MKTKLLLLALILRFASQAQTFPTFSMEYKVTINGLTHDAMEPFISLDGNTLFFNSLNSAATTDLFYATKINDTTFNYVGLVTGCYDPSSNHLDAVPSIDSLNNFFWTSLRTYPGKFETIYKGNYSAGNVSNLKRVYGNFNIYSPGWLVMDAAINFQGTQLIYTNAYFNSCAFGAPCKATLGVAQKMNDTIFNKLSNSDGIFKNINDTNYIVYAPQMTKDYKEIYFTRLLKSTTNTEICISQRNHATDTFKLPTLIHSKSGFLPEAATPTSDNSKIYYHQKDASGKFKIFMKYRSIFAEVNEIENSFYFLVYPNPSENIIHVQLSDTESSYSLELYSSLGTLVLEQRNKAQIDVSKLPSGIYYLRGTQNNQSFQKKIQKL